MKGAKLQRLFTAFPSGWPGLALLLLRALIGFTLLFEGVVYLNTGDTPSFKVIALGVILLATGACVLAGLLTPLACIFTILGSIGIGLSWLPVPEPNALSGNLVVVNLVVMAIAIGVLGPGAFSLDSRMFGRREIVIPPSARADVLRQRIDG